MASDDESKDKASKLTCREEYPGWKSRVQMLALAKGDVNGIGSNFDTTFTKTNPIDDLFF